MALAILIALWDWNWFKGPIERQVQARTGRSFDIGGDLDVDLGRITTIRADALRFGNAPWSKEPTMASADRLEFGIEVWPLLLRREVRIPDIHLDKPRLRLEKGPKGVGNWVFGETGRHAAAVPPPVDRRRPAAFHRQRGENRHRRQRRQRRARQGRRPRRRSTPRAAAAGRATDSPCAAAPNRRWTCATRTRPYRIDAHAQAGATQAHARGTLLDPLRLRDFDLQAGAVRARTWPTCIR